MTLLNTADRLYLGSIAIDQACLGATAVWPRINNQTLQVIYDVPGTVGAWYDPPDVSTLFTDFNGTIPFTTEGQTIGKMLDKSGNGLHASKLNGANRPAVAFLPGSYRPALTFDVDDSLLTTFPNLGTNCTIGYAIPGTGAVILTGQTINGNTNFNTGNTGMAVFNRPLTADETALLTTWMEQRSGVADEYNVSYGADPDEKIDVYHSSGHAKAPTIIMVHGGAWRTGSKVSPNVVKNKLLHWLPQGFTFVSVEYQKAVGTSPITQANSVAKAIAFVQSKAASWGCSPTNIVLMGHSAGCHLVTLATVEDDIRVANGVTPWLGLVALDTAAYNVQAIMSTTHDPLYDEPWGVEESHWIAGSPTLQLTAKPPPMFLVGSSETGGEGDSINAVQFANAVIALGGTAPIYEAALTHEQVNAELGALGEYTDTIDAFIQSLGL